MECENVNARIWKEMKNKKWMWMQDSMKNVICYELYEMECEYEAYEIWNGSLINVHVWDVW